MNKISIAIPAHNEEESIKTNLTSIVSSDFKKKDFEIIVCLSACTDKTREKILEFKKDNPKLDLRIIESRIRGKVRAYKALDKYIKNDVIVFIDADCGSKNDAIYRIYSKLKNADDSIKIVSGNAIDPRYTDKKIKPKSLIEAFNRSFWQHPPRKVINGQFFAERKGIVQVIPNETKLDDVYLSLTFWNNFLKDDEAKIVQGSAQTMYEVVRYQKNIQAGIRQIKELLLNNIADFNQISKELYGQFDVNLSDKNKYYPNISIPQLLTIKILIWTGKVWGNLSSPTWNQTKGSKKIAIDN